MPTIKSRFKQVRKNAERYEETKANRSSLKTSKNKFNEFYEANDVEQAEKALSKIFSNVDIAVKNNVIHKNKAARIKSRYTLKLDELKAS